MTPLSAHLALAFSAFLSATLLPGSSEAALLLFTTQHPQHIHSLLVVATLANVLGSCLNYAMGRGLAAPLLQTWLGGPSDAKIRGKWWFQRFGAWSLLLAWVPIIGDPLTVIAGAMKIPFTHFLVLVGLGKAARYAMLLLGAAALN